MQNTSSINVYSTENGIIHHDIEIDTKGQSEKLTIERISFLY
jgi:hypothetical protein